MTEPNLHNDSAVSHDPDERLGHAFAMAMGALYEFAAHACETDRALAKAAIENVNGVLGIVNRPLTEREKAHARRLV